LIILAFDQAPRNIGFAHGEIGGVPTRGVKENPDYGENTARLGKHVREWALQLIKSSGAERVYFEQVLVRRHGLYMPTLFKQLKVACAIETAAEMAGLIDDCFETDISDWRREFYLGERPSRGADSESEVWKSMAKIECARRGWLVDDHNAAEACGIWFYGCLHTDRRLRAKHNIEAKRKELHRWNAEAV
jgi:hypothetical protein